MSVGVLFRKTYWNFYYFSKFPIILIGSGFFRYTCISLLAENVQYEGVFQFSNWVWHYGIIEFLLKCPKKPCEGRSSSNGVSRWLNHLKTKLATKPILLKMLLVCSAGLFINGFFWLTEVASAAWTEIPWIFTKSLSFLPKITIWAKLFLIYNNRKLRG